MKPVNPLTEKALREIDALLGTQTDPTSAPALAPSAIVPSPQTYAPQPPPLQSAPPTHLPVAGSLQPSESDGRLQQLLSLANQSNTVQPNANPQISPLLLNAIQARQQTGATGAHVTGAPSAIEGVPGGQKPLGSASQAASLSAACAASSNAAMLSQRSFATHQPNSSIAPKQPLQPNATEILRDLLSARVNIAGDTAMHQPQPQPGVDANELYRRVQQGRMEVQRRKAVGGGAQVSSQLPTAQGAAGTSAGQVVSDDGAIQSGNEQPTPYDLAVAKWEKHVLTMYIDHLTVYIRANISSEEDSKELSRKFLTFASSVLQHRRAKGWSYGDCMVKMEPLLIKLNPAFRGARLLEKFEERLRKDGGKCANWTWRDQGGSAGSSSKHGARNDAFSSQFLLEKAARPSDERCRQNSLREELQAFSLNLPSASNSVTGAGIANASPSHAAVAPKRTTLGKVLPEGRSKDSKGHVTKPPLPPPLPPVLPNFESGQHTKESPPLQAVLQNDIALGFQRQITPAKARPAPAPPKTTNNPNPSNATPCETTDRGTKLNPLVQSIRKAQSRVVPIMPKQNNEVWKAPTTVDEALAIVPKEVVNNEANILTTDGAEQFQPTAAEGKVTLDREAFMDKMDHLGKVNGITLTSDAMQYLDMAIRERLIRILEELKSARDARCEVEKENWTVQEDGGQSEYDRLVEMQNDEERELMVRAQVRRKRKAEAMEKADREDELTASEDGSSRSALKKAKRNTILRKLAVQNQKVALADIVSKRSKSKAQSSALKLPPLHPNTKQGKGVLPEIVRTNAKEIKTGSATGSAGRVKMRANITFQDCLYVFLSHKETRKGPLVSKWLSRPGQSEQMQQQSQTPGKYSGTKT